MSNEVEELFGEGGGAPTPRVWLVWSLLVSGVIVSILGLACLSVPGGILVLLAVMTIETEMDRVENGYLPADERSRVQTLRNITYGGLALVILIFFLQGYLFCGGYYEMWGEWLFGADPVFIPPVR